MGYALIWIEALAAALAAVALATAWATRGRRTRFLWPLLVTATVALGALVVSLVTIDGQRGRVSDRAHIVVPF